MKAEIKVLLILALVGAALFGLSACSQAPEGTTAAATEPTAIAAIPTETLEAPSIPSPTVEAAPTAVANTCADCHLDKELLIAAAKPEEEVISESSGEG